MKNARWIEVNAIQHLSALPRRWPGCSEERHDGEWHSQVGTGAWAPLLQVSRMEAVSPFPFRGSNGPEFTMFAPDNPKHASQKPARVISRAGACVEEGGGMRSK